MPMDYKKYAGDTHKTQHGKRDRMSQGSVADRGGYDNMPAYDQELPGASMGKNGYGFGKKKKNNPHKMSGGY